MSSLAPDAAIATTVQLAAAGDEAIASLNARPLGALSHLPAPLVSLLGREPDSGVRNFIAIALRVLTRKDFGTDAGAWAGWLELERQRGQLEKILPPVDPLEDTGLATPVPTSNGNGNGNDKDKDKEKNPPGKGPKSTPPVPTKKPKFIPTLWPGPPSQAWLGKPKLAEV